MTYESVDDKADDVPTPLIAAIPLVLYRGDLRRPESSRVAPEFYPLLATADARRLAYCRRILT
jgi:hypothetical protein